MAEYINRETLLKAVEKIDRLDKETNTKYEYNKEGYVLLIESAPTADVVEVIKQKDIEIDILIRKKEALRDEICELQAEIERFNKLQKPTATSGYRIENGKVVFYTSILNGYRYEYENIDRLVNDMNVMLQNAYKNDEIVGYYKGKLQTTKTEAIKEFAERLKQMPSVMNCEYEWSYLDIDNLVKEMVGEDVQ